MEDNGHTSEEDMQHKLIHEKIVKQSPGKWSRFKKMGLKVCLAIVLGAAAGISFGITVKWIQQPKGAEPNSLSEETISEPETEPVVQKTEEVSIEEIQETENISTQETPVPTSEGSLETKEDAYSICQRLETAFLTVSVTRNQGVDWFDTALEHVGEIFGVVVEITDTEILMLASSENLDGTEIMRVTIEGNEAEVRLKSADYLDGIAVLSIERESIGDAIDQLYPVPFGDSDTLQLGQPVIAMGSPMGYCSSVAYTMISYSHAGSYVADGNYQIYYTDIAAVPSGFGVLVNMNGEIVGWISDQYKRNNLQNVTSAIGINDLKEIINGLMDGRSTALLGIQGQDVSEEMSEQTGVPVGYYITNVMENSPAYDAGIQSGDVAVKIREKKVKNWRGVQRIIQNSSPGTSITVTVLRKGREDYKEIEFEITLRER